MASYGIITSRFVEHQTIFKLKSGNTVSAYLPRRQKGDPAPIAWDQIKDDFMTNYQQRNTPVKAHSGDNRGTEDQDEQDGQDDGDEDGTFQEPIVLDDNESDADSQDPDLAALEDNNTADVAGPEASYNGSDDMPSTPASRPRPSASGSTNLPRMTSTRILNQILKAFVGNTKNAPEDTFNKHLESQDTDTVPDLRDDGIDGDKRKRIVESIKGSRMLKLYFAHKKMKVGPELLQWAEKNVKSLPIECVTFWRMGHNFFNVDMARQGKTLRFGILAYNEAYNVRNTSSSHHYAANLIPCQSILELFGTTMFNNVVDCQGYMFLFAMHTNLDARFTYDFATPVSVSVLTRSQDVITRGIVTVLSDDDDNGFLDRLHAWANQDLPRRQWWCFLAKYRSFIDRSSYGSSQKAANAFLNSFVSTRKINTPLVLPNGTTCFPSSNLLLCIV